MRITVAALLLAAIAVPGAAQDKKPRKLGKYAEMDHGPFYSGTIDTLFPGKGSFALKGIAVTVDRNQDAAVCFDTELLKISAGWTGGTIGHPTGRDGIEGQPYANGTIRFGTKKGSLGWSRGGSWTDPRPKPYGPLPHDWARYRGLYVHGDKVVFAYRLGEVEVLDHAAFDPNDETFTRTLSIGAGTQPLAMLVCEKDGASASLWALDRDIASLDEGERVTQVGLSGEGATLRAGPDKGRIELHIPARAAALTLCVGVWSGPKGLSADAQARLKRKPADLAELLKGGAGRNTAVTVKGTLGTEPGPYVVDTLTVPYDNPSKSYMRLTAVDFFSDGKRAAVGTMDGDVWIVSGIDASLEALVWKRFASGLFQPLGLRIIEDTIYTLGRDQITRLHDLNGDGEADFYECFNNDCGVTANYHEFTHDLHTDSKGDFYYAKGSSLGNAVVPQHGTIVKISKDGRRWEVVATGFRAPNGMSVGPRDEITSSDNQGDWTPATPINWITPGRFCGFLPCSHQNPPPTERPPALCWIPHRVDNSGGGQVWVTSDRWGPLRGELLHLSYGKCLLFHVLRENVGGEMQGGVVKFPFKFVSGMMRGRFNPADGQLYVAGMRGWQTDAPREGGLQRVRYTGKPVHTPTGIKTSSRGLEISFTNPLDKTAATNLENYTADWCNLQWTRKYGSDEFWVSEPAKKGREPLPIQAASLSPDGKTVTLSIAGLKPVYCLALKYKLKAADGTPVEQEINYTINRLSD